MAIQNVLIKPDPQLIVKEISDVYLRKNAQSLVDYFQKENQLFGFRMFEKQYSGAVSNDKISHGLGIVPQDIIVTRLVGTGSVTFNHGLFDSSNVDLTVTGACSVRFFVGRYWASPSNIALSNSDSTTYYPSVVQTVSTSAGALNVVTASKDYSATSANDVILCDTSNAAFPMALPSAVGFTKRLSFKKISTDYNLVTFTPVTGQTVDIATLATFGEVIDLVSDGHNWQCIAHTIPGTWNNFPDLTAGVLITGVTANPSFGTITEHIARWRRTGGDMEMMWTYRQSSTGGAGTGTYLFNLPAGLVMDTSIAGTSAAADGRRGAIGTFTFHGIATTGATGPVWIYDSLRLYFGIGGGNSAGGGIAGIYSSTFQPFSVSATYHASMRAKAPIVGWSA